MQNLHHKSKSDLLKLLKNNRTEWMKLKMDLKMNKLKDVHAPLKKRREIARIKTVLRQKELENETI